MVIGQKQIVSLCGPDLEVFIKPVRDSYNTKRFWFVKGKHFALLSCQVAACYIEKLKQNYKTVKDHNNCVHEELHWHTFATLRLA